MAEQPGKDEQILINVVLSDKDVQAKAEAARLAIRRIKDELSTLEKEYKNGSITAEEYAKSQQSLTNQLNSANDNLRGYTKTISDNDKAQKAAQGSIKEMRANLSILTDEYISLSAEKRNNAKTGGVLQAQIKALSDELKANEGALGDNRRNVGNYAGDIEKAISGSSDFSDNLSELKEKLDIARSAIKGQIDGFKGLTEGMNTTQKAGVGVKLSLQALGIGILISAIVALMGYFTKFQGGMDKLAQVTKAVDLAFGAFIESIVNGFKIIAQAFTSFEKFKNLLSDLAGNADKASVAIANAARAGIDIEKTNQQIEASEIKLGVARAKNRAEIERQKKLSEDTTKSLSVREQAAKRAYSIEIALLKEQELLQARRLKNIERENAIGPQSREKDKKLAEATEALYGAQEESLGRQTELQNSLNSIRQEAADKAKQANDAGRQAAKNAANERIAESERALIQARRNGQETLAIEQEIIRRRRDAELLDAKGSNSRALIRAKADAEIYKLTVENAATLATKVAETRQASLEALLVLAEKGSKQELLIQQDLLRQRAELEKADLVTSETNIQLRAAKTRLVDERLKADLLAGQEAYNTALRAKLNDAVRAELDIEQNAAFRSLAIELQNQRNRIDFEERAAKEEIALSKDTAEEKERAVRLVESKANADRRAVRQQEREIENRDALTTIEVRAALAERGSRDELRARIDLAKQKLAIDLQNEKLIQAERIKLNADTNRQIADLQKDYIVAQIDKIGTITSQANTALTTVIDAQLSAQQKKLDQQNNIAVKSAGTNAELRAKIDADYEKKKEKINRDAATKRQKIASAENAINTALSVTRSFFDPGGFAGVVLGALALATGIANQVKIDSQQFASGGYVSDNRGGYLAGPGTGTSDSISARLSNGESVVNARSTAMFYPVLSAINQAGGGVPFPNAPKVDVGQRLATGGTLGSPVPILDPMALKNAFADALREMPTPVLAVSEYERVKNRVTVVASANDY